MQHTDYVHFLSEFESNTIGTYSLNKLHMYVCMHTPKPLFVN